MSARASAHAKGVAVGRNGQGKRRPAALTVRLASRTDLVPLGFFFDTVLRRDYFVRRGQLEELVTGPHHQVYVAELDAVLVGVAITTRGSRLVNALVHPAYRGLGIGTELVQGSHAREVRAKLNMSSGDPRGFYRSLGFVSTGLQNEKGNIELWRLPDAKGTTRSQGRAARSQDRRRGRADGNGQALVKRKIRK